MANIKFDKKLFEKEIGKLDGNMQNKISMFGTPLEGFNDSEIEVEIFPNRPDLLSYHGFKRSFLSFIGKNKGIPNYKLKKPEKNYLVKIDSSVENIRPNTACAIVKNLKLDDKRIKEIIDLQEKIHFTLGRKRKKIAIGIYPLEKIKLPIVFRALEPDKIRFVPLDSEKEMSGLEILQRHPAGKEYAHLLAGKIKFPVFVDSDEKILSMPPIINSDVTGKVTEKTKDVFVECSGNDFSLLKKCLNIFVTVLSDMGGSVYQMEIEKRKKELTPDFSIEKIKVSINNTEKLLGIKLSEKQFKNLIEKMGYNYNKGEAEIPCWRTDILHEVDLIEDVAIAYGYDNFVPEIPEVSTIGEQDEKEKMKKKISEILCGLGMIEVSNYHLSTKKDIIEKMGFNEKKEDFIMVEDSKTDYKYLRNNLAHFLLKNIAENVDSEYPQKIFETGRVFVFDKGRIVEKEKLAIAITPGNFTELKQVLDYFSRLLELEIGISDINPINSCFIDGRAGEIKLNRETIGTIGEVHPKILKNCRIRMPVSLLEIDLEKVFMHF